MFSPAGVRDKSAVRGASGDNCRHLFETFVVGRNTVGEPFF